MIYKGETIQQYGDGSSCRDYTFIDDIAHGVLCAIREHKQGFEVYNLGKGSTITLLEFIQLIETLLGKKAKRTILPDQPGDVPFTQADISKARTLLGYDPKTSTAEGMRVFVDWYLKRQHSAGGSDGSDAVHASGSASTSVSSVSASSSSSSSKSEAAEEVSSAASL
jgi:UDP-glucuronate 4-epimerase